MAGAGQPWYMPISWPVGHVSTAIKKPENDEPGKPSASPYLDIVGHLTAMAAAVRSWRQVFTDTQNCVCKARISLPKTVGISL